ncbi:hypothetical protein AOQ84DRAFT_298309, partial [Glonium stellatum]
GCWLLAAGCWLPDAGCWMLDAGDWQLPAGSELLADGGWLFFFFPLCRRGPGTGRGQASWSRTAKDQVGVGIRAAAAMDAGIALTRGQQHYRYGCFAQALCGLEGLRA